MHKHTVFLYIYIIKFRKITNFYVNLIKNLKKTLSNLLN